jgi:hypothetical protein
MDAVEEAFKHIAREKEKGADVRLVSFRQFTDWLDVQRPEIVSKLQSLQVGERPAGGWKAFLSGTSGTSGKTPSSGSSHTA